MKKTILFTTILCTTLLFLSACTGKKTSSSNSDQSWSTVEKNKKLTVATSGTLFPASYKNDTKELTGYDIEVIKEVAKRLELEIAFQEYNVDGQIAAVETGRADLAANDFSITEGRKEKFIFSTPIRYSFSSMIVRASDDSGIASLEDLKGKKAAGEPNTSYMKIAEKYGATLVTYDNASNDQYLTDVANGRTDVILNDYYLQKMSVAALPDIPVKILEDVYFNAVENAFLFKKDSVALQEKINKTLADMKSDGTLKEISEEFFYEDLSVEPTKVIQENIEVD